VAEFLGDYLANELVPQARTVFESHLAECPDCVAYLYAYAGTVRLARGAYEGGATEAGVPEQLVRAIVAARLRRT